MIEELSKNIYRISVPLAGSPLKSLNSYFFRGDESDWVMDTGFNTQSCEDALRAGLTEVGARFDRINVINTHMHGDHLGLDYAFLGKDCHIYLSRIDAEQLRLMVDGSMNEARKEKDAKEGASAELMEKMYAVWPSGSTGRKRMEIPFERIVPVEDREVLHLGCCDLQLILVPGHTPGNAMFWDAQNGFMFTGDNLLYDISPNITYWPGMEDSLGAYLESLKTAAAFPVRRGLPGHREEGDYQARIQALLEHHERRLCEVERILAEAPGLTAFEITYRMKWRVRSENGVDIPIPQLRFAAGEAISHIDHLVKTGRISRREENGVYHYYAK